MHKRNGFTLIELLVCVAIMAILTTIGYVNYSEYIRKARRADAQSSLIELAVAQEKYFQQHHSYTQDISSSAGLANGSAYSEHDHYKISVTLVNEQNNGFIGFTLMATAQGSQAQDLDCFKLAINHLNQQLSYDGDNQQTKNCWH